MATITYNHLSFKKAKSKNLTQKITYIKPIDINIKDFALDQFILELHKALPLVKKH
jgi:hypothetical protein